MVPPQQGDEIERDFGPFAQGERSRFWGLLCLWSLRAIYGLIAMFVLFGVASIIAGSLHPNSALSLTLADIMLYARWAIIFFSMLVVLVPPRIYSSAFEADFRRNFPEGSSEALHLARQKAGRAFFRAVVGLKP